MKDEEIRTLMMKVVDGLASSEEKEALATALNGLKGIIEIALAAITGPGTEETPEEDATEGDTPQDETSGDASTETTPPEKKPKILS